MIVFCLSWFLNCLLACLIKLAVFCVELWGVRGWVGLGSWHGVVWCGVAWLGRWECR